MSAEVLDRCGNVNIANTSTQSMFGNVLEVHIFMFQFHSLLADYSITQLKWDEYWRLCQCFGKTGFVIWTQSEYQNP